MGKLLYKLKKQQSECTEQNLPHNRWQVFCDVLKRRWRFLLATSLLTSIFCLPYFAWNWIVNQSIRQLTLKVEVVDFVRLLSYVNTKGAVNIAFLALCGVGISGGVYVVQRLVWGEVVFVGDFWQGVKDNPWKNAVVFALPGVAVWCVEFVFVYVPSVEMFAFQRMLMYGFSVLLVAYVAAVCVFFAVQNAVYNVGFFACFKNSFVLALKGLLPITGFLVVAITPQTVPFFFYNTVVDVVGYAVVALFGIGYATLVLTLAADYVLDKEINSVNYPQIVDKGIVRSK